MIDSEATEVFARACDHFAKTGFPPPVSRSLWSWDAVASYTLEDAEEVLEQLPRHDRTDPAHRAAIVNLLIHLRLSDVMTTFPGSFPPAVVLGTAARTYLSRAREDFPPATLPLLRWELQAATATEDLEAVIRLGSQWTAVDHSNTCWHLVPRTLFGLLKDFADGTSSPIGFLDPTLAQADEAHASIWEALTLLRATVVEPLPGFLSPHENVAKGFISKRATESRLALGTDNDPDRLLSMLRSVPRLCLSHFERVRESELEQDPASVAVAGWCEYAVAALEDRTERYLSAARRFSALSRSPAVNTAPYQTFQSDIHSAAAHCFGAALKFDEAETHAREWVRLSPKDAAARKRLAEFLYKQQRIPEAILAFEDYVRCSNESGGEDWSASLLLKLGLESLTRQELSTAVETAAFGSPFRPQGVELTKWLSPWTAALVRGASDKWWAGLFILTDETARLNLGEAAARELAGAAFGEAVNLQLRKVIAEPFANLLPDPLGLSLDPYWKKFVAGKATLGEQLSCLLQTREPRTDIAGRLQGWIATNTPGFADHLRRKGGMLMTLAVLRGDAAHDVITPTQLRQLFNEASALLERLPAAQPSGATER